MPNNLVAKISAKLSGRKILILGFGREGIASYKFLRQHFPTQKVTIADANEHLLDSHKELKNDQNLTLCLGENYLKNLADFEIIFKTPGISLKNLEISSFKDRITSQLELFLENFSGTTIGITGTKGKSTTSSLIYQILADQSIHSILLGNIGVPIFDHLGQITPEMLVVLEMSSHQLEFIKHSPNFAIITNLYEEHLDFYHTFQDYILAKANIFKFQNSCDSLIYNSDSPELQNLIKTVSPHYPGKKYPVNLKNSPFDPAAPRQLLGDYNLYNIAYALTTAQALKENGYNVNLSAAMQTIANFQTLRHHLEKIGTYDEVTYYDNSIGTIPAATITAVEALGNVDTLIIGGMDRGVSQAPLLDFLRKSQISNLICMPETGWKVADQLESSTRPQNIFRVNTLLEAVALAKEHTAKGHSCLLSPAAASFNDFKNYEEKGDKFQALVKNLGKNLGKKLDK